MELPGTAESCWVATAPQTRYRRYEQSDRADVAVIGAGIVGLTAAFRPRSWCTNVSNSTSSRSEKEERRMPDGAKPERSRMFFRD